jgi:hypothetical protein
MAATVAALGVLLVVGGVGGLCLQWGVRHSDVDMLWGMRRTRP